MLQNIIQYFHYEFHSCFNVVLFVAHQVKLLADTCGTLAKSLDLEFDVAAVLGNVRNKR